MAEMSELHNRIAGEVVSSIIKPVMQAGGRDSDILVVLESVTLGVIIANEKLFGVSRRASVEMVENLTQAVMERLATQ